VIAQSDIAVIAKASHRVKAFLYDYLLIFAYLAAVSAVGSFLTLGPFAARWSEFLSSPVRMDLFAFVVSVLPVVTYFALAESSQLSATWGKKRLGLRVLDVGGARLSKVQGFARAFLKFLPWQMAHTAMFHIPGFPLESNNPPDWTVALLAFAWVLVAVYLVGLTSAMGGRTAYDRLTGCSVVAYSVGERQSQ